LIDQRAVRIVRVDLHAAAQHRRLARLLAADQAEPVGLVVWLDPDGPALVAQQRVLGRARDGRRRIDARERRARDRHRGQARARQPPQARQLRRRVDPAQPPGQRVAPAAADPLAVDPPPAAHVQRVGIEAVLPRAAAADHAGHRVARSLGRRADPDVGEEQRPVLQLEAGAQLVRDQGRARAGVGAVHVPPPPRRALALAVEEAREAVEAGPAWRQRELDDARRLHGVERAEQAVHRVGILVLGRGERLDEALALLQPDDRLRRREIALVRLDAAVRVAAAQRALERRCHVGRDGDAQADLEAALAVGLEHRLERHRGLPPVRPAVAALQQELVPRLEQEADPLRARLVVAERLDREALGGAATAETGAEGDEDAPEEKDGDDPARGVRSRRDGEPLRLLERGAGLLPASARRGLPRARLRAFLARGLVARSLRAVAVSVGGGGRRRERQRADDRHQRRRRRPRHGRPLPLDAANWTATATASSLVIGTGDPSRPVAGTSRTSTSRPFAFAQRRTCERNVSELDS
jgi:hypothetical protein